MAVVRHYLRNTQDGPGAGQSTYDLSTVQGAPATLVSASISSTSFVEVFRWQFVVGEELPEALIPFSASISATSSANLLYRFRFIRRAGGADQSFSAYSAERNTTGAAGESLSLAASWAVGDTLVLAMELRRNGGGGSRTVTVGVNNAASWVDPDLNAVPVPVFVESAASGAWSVRAFEESSQAGAWEARNYVSASQVGAWSVEEAASQIVEASQAGAWEVRRYQHGPAAGFLLVDGEPLEVDGLPVYYEDPNAARGAWEVEQPASYASGAASGAWVVRGFVDANAPSAWAVRGFQNGQAAGAWSVRNFASAAQAGAWLVRGFASREQAGAWSVRAYAGAAQPGAWAVRGFVSGQAAGAWAVRQHAGGTGAGSWQVMRFASGQAGGAWRVNNYASGFAAGAWEVFNTEYANGFAVGAWQVGGYAQGFAAGAWAVERFTGADNAKARQIALRVDLGFVRGAGDRLYQRTARRRNTRGL